MNDREIIAANILGHLLSRQSCLPGTPAGGEERAAAKVETVGEYNVWLAIQYTDLLIHILRGNNCSYQDHDVWP